MQERRSFERIQKRLINQGKFQLEQTLILQDDEIDRLKSRLRIMESRITKSRFRWALKAQTDQAQVETYRTKIKQIRDSKREKMKLLRNDHALAIKSIRDKHTQEISDIKRQLTLIFSKQAVPASPDHSAFSETLDALSQSIQRINSFKEEESSNRVSFTDREIAKADLRVRTLRVRSEELAILVEKARKKNAKIRAKCDSKVSEIQSKARIFDTEITANKSILDATLIKWESEEREPSSLAQLREQIHAAQCLRKSIKQRIRVMNSEFEASNRVIEAEKSSLLHKFGHTNQVSSVIDIKSAIEHEQSLINETAAALASNDTLLEKLRKENVQLLRKVNKRDYLVNGRNGDYQRYSEITEFL